jgi:hypothetical protein
VKEAWRFHLSFPEYKIYSNIELHDMPYVKVDSAKILFQLHDPCFLLLDELWHLADSRKSQSLVNDVFSMLLLRSRKQFWRVAYSQQWYTQTDLRIRFITDFWIQPEIRNLKLIERIYDKHAHFLKARAYWAANFYDLYDSYADPFTLNMDELEYEYDKYRGKFEKS